jgi:Flp pilus assembly protein TadD
VLLDGDSIALEMIEKGAYSLAFKRLEKLITRDAVTEKTAENLYLQGVSLEFQSDLTGASSFYNEALLLDPGNETILDAVNRIKKAALVSKKSV